MEIVVVKNPSDFVGSVLGESEKNTKGILASTLGKVLVIDEAYGLSGGGTGEGSGSQSDIYKTAVVDTIVAEVQGNAWRRQMRLTAWIQGPDGSHVSKGQPWTESQIPPGFRI